MVVSYAPDLMVRSKLDLSSRHYGVPVQHVVTASEFRHAVEKGQPVLVLLDLDYPGVDMLELVREARRLSRARIVGFCSHAMTDLIRAARQAGADTVLPNSTFVAGIPGLLAPLSDSAREDVRRQPET
ncbi:response regulator [bacterium]|nr:response regulator [bacterium]